MGKRGRRGKPGNVTEETRRKVAKARSLAHNHTSLESLAKAVGSSPSTLSAHGVSAMGAPTRLNTGSGGSGGGALVLTLEAPADAIYNQDGYDGYDDDGYDDDGYDRGGRDRDGCDSDGFTRLGFDLEGYDKDGYHRKTGKTRDGRQRSGGIHRFHEARRGGRAS